MEKALQAYTAGEMTLREASSQFGVPKSTLHDRVSGRVQTGAPPGAPKYLDDEEEGELVRWMEGCAQIGYAKSVKELRAVDGPIEPAKQLGLCCCQPWVVGSFQIPPPPSPFEREKPWLTAGQLA